MCNWLPKLGLISALAIVSSFDCVKAQITPDGTLPNNSNVTLDGNTRIIEGGTTRGANLFHSFSEFSVPPGSTAFFNNAPDIQNILTRVTGGSISNIDGLIQSHYTANLFVINPSGIVFGKDASLNIGGSFVATTANAIGFGNLGFFSASNPEAPSPLLTINPSAFFFNQTTSGRIAVQSITPAGLDPSNQATYGLRVPDGRSLLLVGGDISINGLGFNDAATGNGGGLKAFDGRIELGGLAAAGTLGLSMDGNQERLSFPDSVARSNVSLFNGAEVNVSASGRGSLAINAQNLSMEGASKLETGIASGSGSVDTKAGNIEINATGTINLNGQSIISNLVQPAAVGNSGDINIKTGSLAVTNGSQLKVSTLGRGDSGNLTIEARDRVEFINGAFAFSQVQGGVGDGGIIKC